MRKGYLGIDVGLSGARGTVISARGRVLAHARIPQETGRLTPLHLSDLVDRTVRMTLAGRRDLAIVCVSVCAYGPAPIFLGEKGKVLAQLALFAAGSPRSSSSGKADGGDDLALRFRHFRNTKPHLVERTRVVCDVTGYLVSRLTGRLTMDNVTAEDYLRLSLPRHVKLPHLAAAQEHAGSLTASAARRMGLQYGIPVALGSYDSTADLVAAGFGNDSRAVIVLGSTMVIGALTSRPVKDRRLRSMPHVGKGWFSGGWTNCAGSSLELADRLLAFRGTGRSTTTPLLWPYFAGERAPVWSQQATGLLAGLTAETTSVDLRQAFVQGIALSAFDIVDLLQTECGAIRKWIVIGGATRNVALMAELADALGGQLNVPRGAEANLGPAILAARSCGLVVRLPIAQRFRGSRSKHRIYVEKLRVYRQVFEAIRPFTGDVARVTRAGRKSA